MSKEIIFSNAFLEARISHDVGSVNNLAAKVNMNPESTVAKICGKEHFDKEEMNKIIDAVNVSSGAECRLLFFFFKEEEQNAHLNLYKAILDNNISPAKIGLEIGVSSETLFNKIAGFTEFRWNEVIAIKEKFFPNYTMSSLFERGVTA